MVSGAHVVASVLKQLGVEVVFGLVGIPVVEIAESLIAHDIRFIAFRNEQSASYAASVYGFSTGKPGVLLVVGGPGVVHALAGVENARSNRFPLLLLAGSAETALRGLGAFQQLDQVSLVRAAGAKFAEQPDGLDSVGRLLEQAYRESYYGQPGVAYIDLPANLIKAQDPDFKIPLLAVPAPAPRSAGDPSHVARAASLIQNAKFPLLIIGKGVAYARAEHAVQHLQAATNLAFIPTPMGKGVISDYNPLNLSAARSAALKSADVVIVLGARLNWILHYGGSGKFLDNVQIVQVSNVGEDLKGDGLGILGDIELVTNQLIADLHGFKAPAVPDGVLAKRSQNEAKALEAEKKVSDQLNYKTVYAAIRETLNLSASNRRIVYVSEGANSMDISRTSFPLVGPRTRLDAGTNATMGLGVGYAIAAKAAEPDALVVAIEGDSAFGFSAMEIETAVRSKLPLIVFVINNSGIYHGSVPRDDRPLPPTALSPEVAYHKLGESMGAWGAECRTLDEVVSATKHAVSLNQVSVINVIIELGKERQIAFGWQASTKKV